MNLTGPLASTGKVVALCGGIGGAKLALGLYHLVPPHRLTVVANIGDDFEHLGLHISPDLDTILYTLSGRADPERGWGRRDETWHFMAALAELGGESWFQLGDQDLAIHVERTQWLRSGRSLTGFAARAAERFGIAAAIVPATDEPLRTIVDTDEGPLPFQRYFVERRCAPVLRAVRFDGAAEASPSPAIIATLAEPDLAAIVVCPSNPYLSIDPILAVPGIRQALKGSAVPVVAVSPVIGGSAVKGPTAKIMHELGVPVTSAAIAKHYDGLLDGIVIDAGDVAEAGSIGIPVATVPTLMVTLDDRKRLAGDVLVFAERLASGRLAEARHG